MRTPPWLLGLALVAACGGGEHPQTTDAAIVADAPDASTLPAGCDYAEQRDTTNDDVSPATGTPEQTGLTFASRTVLCGTLDASHFDGDITVDVDGYVVTVAGATDALVRIYGAGAEAIDLVGVDIYTGPNLDQLVGTSTFYGDHGVTAVHLPAGTYELVAFALSGAAIAAPVPYRIEVTSDTPATRCPQVTTGDYVEAHDGSNHDGNDVIAIPSGAPPALTASTADQPEPTQLTLAPAMNVEITGSAADITAADQYEDKDTFAIATGAATNELAVRLTWAGTTADLDYLLFEANTTDPVVRAATVANQADELRTFSVKPGTSYWLLVAAKVGSTGLPAAYGASLCGATFAP